MPQASALRSRALLAGAQRWAEHPGQSLAIMLFGRERVVRWTFDRIFDSLSRAAACGTGAPSPIDQAQLMALSRLGAGLSSKDEAGDTLIVRCVAAGLARSFSAALALGGDIDEPDALGRSPLLIALAMDGPQRRSCARALIRAGCRIGAVEEGMIDAMGLRTTFAAELSHAEAAALDRETDPPAPAKLDRRRL